MDAKNNQGSQRQTINESYQKIVVATLLGFAHGTTHDPDGILKVRSIGCGALHENVELCRPHDPPQLKYH